MIEYEVQTSLDSFGERSKYQGWPDDEKDKMWAELYSGGISVLINEQAAQKLSFETERLPVPGMEDNYMIGLDVFHQLHCVVNRQKNSQDKAVIVHKTMELTGVFTGSSAPVAPPRAVRKCSGILSRRYFQL